MVFHAPPVSGPVFCMSHTPFAFPVLFYIHIQWFKSKKCFLNSFVMEFLLSKVLCTEKVWLVILAPGRILALLL